MLQVHIAFSSRNSNPFCRSSFYQMFLRICLHSLSEMGVTNQMMPLAGVQNCWPLKRLCHLAVPEAQVLTLLLASPLREATTCFAAL